MPASSVTTTFAIETGVGVPVVVFVTTYVHVTGAPARTKTASASASAGWPFTAFVIAIPGGVPNTFATSVAVTWTGGLTPWNTAKAVAVFVYWPSATVCVPLDS